jgi:hypothetical protein
MKKYRTTSNQSWFDLALQLLSDASRAFELCILNKRAFINEIPPDTEILYPEDSQVTIENGFDNQDNNIISTSQNQILLANSFSFDFNLNEFV